MKDPNFSKTKFNIAWVSCIVIFLGAIVYIPMLKFAEKEKEVVYYRTPVFVTSVKEPAILENVVEEESKDELIETSSQNNFVIEASPHLLTKNLQMGDNDEEVRILQQYLNNHGFLIAESGPGSPGMETTLFGAGTRDALIKFQEANAGIILHPAGLDKGTGVLGELTRNFINS